MKDLKRSIKTIIDQQNKIKFPDNVLWSVTLLHGIKVCVTSFHSNKLWLLRY